MRSLQKKLFLYVLIIGIIPMLFFTCYYCNIMQNNELNKLENESENILQKYDNSLVVKVNRIQNTSEILLGDADLCRVLSEVDEEKEGRTILQNKLDTVFDNFRRGERNLVSILLLPISGGVYISGDKAFGDNPFNFIMQYDSKNINADKVTWMGLKDESQYKKSNVILAGVILRDSSYKKNEQRLASVYFVFEDSIFSEKDSNITPEYISDEDVDVNNKENITIYDENINLIHFIGNENLRNALFTSPNEERDNHIKNSKKSFFIDNDGNDYMVVTYTSPVTGWKLVRCFSSKQYFAHNQNIVWVMVFCFFLMIIAWCLIHYFVVKKMTSPIRDLLDAMKLVEQQNFDVTLNANTKGDFGVINNGFNNMLSQIKFLFEQTIEVEKNRREQETLMLRYQMNPHFLYNTIGAIRSIALQNNQDKISKMLLVLSRFLRNAILTTNEMLDVRTEISNINDYISLYQIRYCEQLNFEIEADENCYDYKVPSMMCQPIIENALIHGINEKLYSGEAKIHIKIEEKDEFLIINIYDNGNGMDENTLNDLFSDNTIQTSVTPGGLHIGLKNIQRRIRLLFGEEYGVEVQSQEGTYTLVKLRLPKIEKIEVKNGGELVE